MKIGATLFLFIINENKCRHAVDVKSQHDHHVKLRLSAMLRNICNSNLQAVSTKL